MLNCIKDRILSEEKECSLSLKCDATLQKRKPDIVLNLNHKGSVFADQTPTPTRFIRNCEEVGLFQDLQNVNPFDETFRRAADAVRNGEQPRLESLCCASQQDDTLHTPNVFPMLPEPQLIPNVTAPCQPVDSSLNVGTEEPPVPKPPRKYNWKRKFGETKISTERRGKNARRSVESGNDGQLGEVGSSAGGNAPHYVIVNRHVTFKLPIPRLPVGPKVFMPNYFSAFSKHAAEFKSDGTSAICKKSMSKKTGKKWSVQTNAGDEAHRRFEPQLKSEIMERNRMAAIRTREKKKHYVAHLEKMKRALVEKTAELEQRVHSLVSENAGLKERISKCQCLKTICTQRDVSQQTEACLESSSQRTLMHPVYEEHNYLGLGEKHFVREVAETTCNKISQVLSTTAKELEKEVFYETLPRPATAQVTCQLFEPALAESAVRSRKPFKKRNLN